MTATKESAENNYDDREISKKDLQLLLQGKLGQRVTVLESTTSSLLPAGENFACSIFKVDALVKRDENEPKEELHMAAKLYPVSETVQTVFDFVQLFDKEIFFYEKFAPALKQLEEEFDAKTKEPVSIGPRLLGVRRSFDPEKKIDEGVVLLLENLKTKGYYTLDKVEGMDLNHSKMTIRALARFHALGIACKQHRPKFFKEEVMAHTQVVPYRLNTEKGNVFEVLLKMMCKDPRIAEYTPSLLKFADPKMIKVFFEYISPEPWLSVAHMDFWTNNILYHKDSEGNIDDVKFLDFQNYIYNSPLRDLPFFLCTSTGSEVVSDHFNELLDLYYGTFIDVLKRLQINTSPFTRESFDAQLKIDAAFEFFHCIIAIKFFCAEIDKNSSGPVDIESVIIFSDINTRGYDKWYRIIRTYIKQGWL